MDFGSEGTVANKTSPRETHFVFWTTLKRQWECKQGFFTHVLIHLRRAYRFFSATEPVSNKIKPVSNSSADWAETHEVLAPAEELLERMALGRRREVLWVGRWTSTGSLFMLMQEVLIGLDGY